MSVRRLLAATAGALAGGLVLAAPAAAQVPLAEESGGSGRTGSTVAIALALVGVVVGAWALRSARRAAALTGLVLALAGLVAGLVALADSGGEVGSGNGRGGAILSVVLALVGLVVGGMALARSRRTA